METKPTVGQTGTRSIGGDCYPVEVISVNANGKRIAVREMLAVPAPGHDFYSNQVYTYRPDPSARIELYSLRKDGRYHKVGNGMGTGSIVLGAPRFYQNPSF